MKQIIAIFLILFVLARSTGQTPDFQVFNYTVNEGLPSNECHDLVQDSLGYIWIATDRGLVKWDGYSFEVYGLKKGLADMVCLELYKDSNQNIWINTLSKNLYKYIPEMDSIVPYMHNDSIQKYLSHAYVFQKIAVNKEGELFLSSIQNETFHVSVEGNVQKVIEANPGNAIYIKKYGDDIFIDRCFDLSQSTKENFNPEFYFEENRLKLCPESSSFESYLPFLRKGFVLTDTHVIVSSPQCNVFIQGGINLSCNYSEPSYIDVISDQENGYFTAERSSGGVKHFSSLSNFQKNNYSNILSVKMSSRLLVDRSENLWVSTLDQGIFYLKKSNVSVIKTSNITDIIPYKDDFFVLEEKSLFKKYNSLFEETPIHTFFSETWSMAVNAKQNGLILTGSKVHYCDLEDSPDFPIKLLSYRLGKSHGGVATNFDGSVLAWGYNALYEVDSESGALIDIYPDDMPIFRILYVLKTRDSTLLLGTTEGLVKIENDIFTHIALTGINENPRINKVFDNEEQFILATTGRGLLWWDGSKITRSLDMSDGLIANNIESIVQGPDNKIIATSKNGFSILEKQDHGYKVFQNYDIRNGLPSNNINQLIAEDDRLIVATTAGLVLVKNDFESKSFVVPIIEDLQINGVHINRQDNLKFSYKENNLNVFYKVVDFTQLGLINYRHRLNEGPWTETKNTSVSFGALKSGDYKLDVEAQNVDGIWGETTSLEFSILPPWWETGIFRSAFLLLLVFGGFLVLRNRIRYIQKEAGIKEELRQLEMSALQAQMNPHFIFNSLNSIQRFIMSNDKESAMTYLSKFANLIRQILNSSVEENITLEKEINMLDNYLSLEKLRYKEKFKYTLEADNGMDLKATEIPPLLIQPFVENAVIHGMKGIKQDGRISVTFHQTRSGLRVLVRDNGHGKGNNTGGNNHKSRGMMVTSRRLKLLNLHKKNGLDISSNFSGQGTVIEILIEHKAVT